MATVLIKKYGNRRLYDTSDSRYVTLDELAAKIRSGSDLRIVDAQTGEDLTQATLTQLVLETGQAAKFLPVQLLTQMIRLSDDALAEFFSRYVTGALDVYLQAKRGMQSIASYNPLTQLPIATDALARMWMGSPFGGPAPYQQYGGYTAPPPYPVGPPPGEPPPDADDAPRKRGDSEPPRKRDEATRKRAETEPPRRRSASDLAADREPPRRRSASDLAAERELPRRRSASDLAAERDGDRAERSGGDRADDVAAMRRELDELKEALRESLPKKRKRRS